MPTRIGREIAGAVQDELDRLGMLGEQDQQDVLDEVPRLIVRLRQIEPSVDIPAEEYYDLLNLAAGMLSDAVPSTGGEEVLAEAEALQREVVAADISESLRAWASYCLGTTICQLVNQEERSRWSWTAQLEQEEQPVRWQRREQLREGRLLLARAGRSPDIESLLRSKALCNLGNELDSSGRWIEAYEAYQDSLAEYPNNGNAAGNLAQLLAARIRLGRGQPAHYAALYNRYSRMAKSLREHTIGISNESTAESWDALGELQGVGHESHDGDPDDPYQQWVATNRLALSVAMEGLGSDSSQWDDAGVDAALVPVDSPTPLAILAAVNVLKSEYLVARQLAYDGIVELAGNAVNDSGSYADTDDDSVYGQPAAKIVLAQRATLDVLDKIAVVANLYFDVGDAPDRVSFRAFWTERTTSELRPELPQFKPWPNHRATLAELAYDIHEEGLYARAQLLRNAGTHRLVHVRKFTFSGPTRAAIVSVGEPELVAASLEALRVARAAFLYLIDFIAEDYEAAEAAEAASLS
ncbi:LA2681 family HEPN domain-containing protein [Herbiconiux sp. CPCC 203407]|uniref:LA2681 family HEPN domain-containing protein n=1 Tax=Herbiconiux oxytropis TaxID=2970915 RepID=A0AA41XAK0_9MICO|nr:LA2681 family HEPN domain-containing protein [Herbiconiux oxytropis]MCS5721052.1 LA2681 family HEPN domain-containing protein [Herbiconiux oxytropis]MCS5724704.1 LA2681 family HEPN domain-containing protein [Herbiconiux oxytropis]